MNTEKKFTVVGTAINPDGTLKVRWANDLVSRIKILVKAKCTDIVLIELPKGMTKLKALEYFLKNHKLEPLQEEAVSLKIHEKKHSAKRANVKTTLTKNIKSRVKSKKSNPAVQKFIDKAAEEAAD